MKRILLFWIILVQGIVAQAVEYGYFSRAHSSSNWSHSITLSEGDRFIFMNADRQISGLHEDTRAGALFRCSYEDRIVARWIYAYVAKMAHSHGGWGHVLSDDMRTILGPCNLEPEISGNQTIIEYKIIRAGEGESKYTVSLNADGTRMAIGEKSGTNGVARVFEYNETDWEQLGSDVN